jgi:hypothetical protein
VLAGDAFPFFTFGKLELRLSGHRTLLRLAGERDKRESVPTQVSMIIQVAVSRE